MALRAKGKGNTPFAFAYLAAFVTLTALTLVWAALCRELFEPLALTGTERFVVLAAYVVALGILCKVFRCFSFGLARLRELVAWTCLAVICTNVVSFLFNGIVLGVADFLLSVVWVSLVQCALAVCLCYVLHVVYVRITPVQRVVAVVGGFAYERRMLMRLADYPERFEITRVIALGDDESNRQVHRSGDSPLGQSVNELLANCDVVVLGGVSEMTKKAVVAYCYEHRLGTMVIPSTTDILMQSFTRMQVQDSVAFRRLGDACSPFQGFVKRAADVVGSVVGLVLFALPMGVCALAIKMHDGGPVIYRQERLTRNGQVFNILKFRSMRVNAERDGVQLASANDDRITPVGRVMRACRLDETPQFINVLKGEMSLVGPRAERPEIAREYEERHPVFAYRLKVKAGLTGLAQVNGRYSTSFEDKLKMDLYYIENFSLREDAALLVETIKIVFSPEAAEGFKAQEAEPLFDNIDWKVGLLDDDAVASFVR